MASCQLNAAMARIAAIACALGCSVCASAATPTNPDITLARDLARFDRARASGDAPALRRSVEFFKLSQSSASELIANYVTTIGEERSGGLVLMGELPQKIDYFSDKPSHKMIAFVDAVVIYQHPMDVSGYRTAHKRLYAFSRDDGQTWRINVLDCIKQADLQAFIPAYHGQPEFAAQAQ